MPRPRIHLICNAHLDPVWQWEWEEGAAEAMSTFRTAADLCDEFPGFVFCHNESILYRWVEEYEPALFRRIKRLVKRGQWHVMGGWHLQPDCNLPSGESFVRQALSGLTYFREKFGVRPRTAINLDPFGHTQGLVQILAKCGYDSYIFCRPGQGDCELPADRFRWIGYDGSEVMAHRVWHYNSPLGGAREKVQRWLDTYPEDPVGIVLWGVGNHGGGPSRQDLRDLTALIAEVRDHQVVHSTPEAYWDEVRVNQVEMPCVNRDLNPWAVGCYTSQVRLKQKHRQLENELYALEKMASSGWLQGLMAYTSAELGEAERDLLTAEFHDILPGSSIQPVEETSLRLLDHGLELVSRAKARAFFALAAGQPQAREGQVPVLVYNPHPYPVETIVECEFQLADFNWSETFTIPHVYQGNRRLPGQLEKEDGNLNLDWRKRMAFRAELKPSQMSRFDCRFEVLPARPAPPQFPDDDDIFTFRTDRLSVTINRKTGWLEEYAVDGVSTINGPCEALVMADDEDPWGMLVHGYGNIAGRFELLNPRDSARFAGVRAQTLPPVRIIEDGEVRTVIEAGFRYNHSFLLLRYKLPKAGTEIEVEARVQWAEKNQLLKLGFPVAGQELRYVGQVAYGVGELPANGDEAVPQKWTAVIADGDRALTCINDGVYGSDCSSAGLRMTLLRSPAYAAHPIGDRPVVPQHRFTPRMDQGERLYHFWLNGGSAEERLAAVDREALAHNERPMALSFFPSGQGAAPLPLVTLSDQAAQVTAVKRSQDGKALVVRLFEPTGQKRTTTLSLPALGLKQKVTLGAFEIKTLRVDPQKKTVTETNLLEEPL